MIVIKECECHRPHLALPREHRAEVMDLAPLDATLLYKHFTTLDSSWNLINKYLYITTEEFFFWLCKPCEPYFYLTKYIRWRISVTILTLIYVNSVSFVVNMYMRLNFLTPTYQLYIFIVNLLASVTHPVTIPWNAKSNLANVWKPNFDLQTKLYIGLCSSIYN